MDGDGAERHGVKLPDGQGRSGQRQGRKDAGEHSGAPKRRLAERSEHAGSVLDPSTTRRRFLQFTLAGSTSLVVGGTWLDVDSAEATVAIPELGEIIDFADVVILAELPYATNLVLEVGSDDRVRFELPRLDKGQGIATALAMLVADELDADYDKTDVVLSDRRRDRPFSITGNSATMRAMWGPVRKLAGQARARLITAAALRWGVWAPLLWTSQGRVHGPNGRVATFGELAADAANVTIPLVSTSPKSLSEHAIVGTPRGRKNARDIVTGRQTYTLDVDHPDALPTVVARAPDVGGHLMGYDDTVARAMPGVVDVVPISSGVAVIAQTFHQAFEARDALETQWAPGPAAGRSDADMRDELEDATPALDRVYWPLKSHTAVFEFPFAAHAMMEVMSAVADVRFGQAEIWYASQSPNYIAAEVAKAIGISEAQVTIHVPFAGGSFGRRLFGEVAVEAAEASKAAGRPVRLMWTRNDDTRHGRFRPMARCALRASWYGWSTYTFQQKIAAASTDFGHGLGDALSAAGVDVLPGLFSQVGFLTMVSLPYKFGDTSHQLVERDLGVPTGSWRSVFSGLTTTCNEIFVDEMARKRNWDELSFRRWHLDDATARRCLDKVADMGDWGRSMPPGHAQGIAVHTEYRSACAYLVEIDTTGPEPRLTRAFCAVDVGVPINPKGLEAQMQGMLVDAWSVMFRAGNHIDDGHVREGSYGDYLWARMNHTPVTTQVHVFPAESGAEPGGAGELGIPAASAACVNAYARATGTQPRRFPIGEFA